MDFRHEWKHEISFPDLLILRQRLRAVARTDPHSVNGKYEIRSLYFDNWQDKALREKIDGVNIREKFRIRYYNGDKSFIQLEKKTKINGLGNKQSAALTEKEAQAIVDGDYEWMRGSNEMLITELYSKILSQCLRPKTIVDYTREAFVYAPGNVRITLDYNIRTGLTNTDFLDTDCVMISAGTPVIILEVKWDSFLPSVIQDAIQLEGRRTTAFSKYAACRIYG
jgi:hypothetical protein